MSSGCSQGVLRVSSGYFGVSSRCIWSVLRIFRDVLKVSSRIYQNVLGMSSRIFRGVLENKYVFSVLVQAERLSSLPGSALAAVARNHKDNAVLVGKCALAARTPLQRDDFLDGVSGTASRVVLFHLLYRRLICRS